MTQTVEITTGARLHFGPLSYLPQHGRHFGGIGLMVAEPAYQVRVQFERSGLMVDSGGLDELNLLQQFRSNSRFPALPPVRFSVARTIPAHQGLGSGTQRALAVGEALSRLAGLTDIDFPRLAQTLNRGTRSAIGINGYQTGGFLVDAGQTAPGTLGEIAVQLPFPEPWSWLLATPQPAPTPVAGNLERQQFERLESMPAVTSGALCRLALTALLPALHTVDFAGFSGALAEYGQLVGEFFRPVQGGVFRSPLMAELAAWVQSETGHAVVQSSWGPTVAIVTSSQEEACDVSRCLQQRFDSRLSVQVVTPLNRPRRLAIDGVTNL